MTCRVSVVLLTMGDRPIALAAAIASVRRQSVIEAEVVLVVNGGSPDTNGVDIVVSPGENLGIPRGRNVGLEAASGDVVMFLDDDGHYLSDTAITRALKIFQAEPDVAVVGLRIIDEDGNTARRHQPWLLGDPQRSGDATSFPGGACAVRRRAFEEVGGLCEGFFYGLEETDLAWRLIDAGWTVRYDAQIQMGHPHSNPTRHDSFHFQTGRNRVWLTHRTLPLPLAISYLATWAAITGVRSLRTPGDLRHYFAGMREALSSPLGPRRPIRWRTAYRMARLGRPPVV